MKNKILWILTLATTALMMSAAGAYDAGLNVVSDFEADTDGIVIYFDKEVDEDLIKNAVELTEAGTIVTDFEVKKVSYINEYKNNQSKTPAYKIEKSDSFAIDTKYSLKINEWLESKDGSTLDGDFEKIFEIEEILIDDFSSDTSKWTLVQTNGNSVYHGNNTLSIKDGKLQLLTGEKNSYNHALLPADYANMFSLEDYTVEFDYTTINDGDAYQFISFGLTTKVLPDINNFNLPRFQVQDGGVRAYLTGNSKYEYTKDSSEAANYKFVAKDNRYVLYVNDKKMYDYTTDELDAVGAFGIIVYGNNAEYHFDNFKITKMTESITVKTAKEEYDINEDVVINLGSEIDVSMLDNSYINVKTGDTEIRNFELSAVDSNSINIHFTKPLEYKTEYTISISDELPAVGKNSYKYDDAFFTTIPPAFDLESFVNKNGTVTAVIKNNREETPVNCIATVVLYDDNNKMIGIEGGKYEVELGKDDEIKIDVGDAVSAKCYVWSDFVSMDTLFEETIVIE